MQPQVEQKQVYHKRSDIRFGRGEKRDTYWKLTSFEVIEKKKSYKN